MTSTATPATAIRGPDQAAEAITGTAHLSWSRISCYQRCPRQFAARYVERRCPDHRSSSMLFGSGIHAGAELHHLARIEGLSVSREEMLLAYEQAWAEDLRQLRACDLRRVGGLTIVRLPGPEPPWDD